MQRAVLGRGVRRKHVFVPIGLGQLLLSGASATARRLLLLSSLASRALLLGFQRILFIQTLRRVLTVTLLELLLEPLILASQLVDRPFQSAYQHHKLIDTQLSLTTSPSRNRPVHAGAISDSGFRATPNLALKIGQLPQASKGQQDTAGRFGKPIVTEIVPAATFWRAEDYHQRYLEKRGQQQCGISRQ